MTEGSKERQDSKEIKYKQTTTIKTKTKQKQRSRKDRKKRTKKASKQLQAKHIFPRSRQRKSSAN